MSKSGTQALARAIGPILTVSFSRDERALRGGILLLLIVIWLEPAGSSLSEPDETRYAEIPRGAEVRCSSCRVWWGDFRTARSKNSRRAFLVGGETLANLDLGKATDCSRARVRSEGLRSGRRFPHILGRDGRWFLISNFFPRELPKASTLTSAALYHTSEQEPGTVRIPLAEVPAAVLARAQRESRGERLVWAVLEEERGERVYEVFTGGRKPRAIELSLSGDLRYVEEEIPEEDLPLPIRADFSRAIPGVQIAYVMRESRRAVAPSVLYEVYFRNGKLRKVEFPGPPGPD